MHAYIVGMFSFVISFSSPLCYSTSTVFSIHSYMQGSRDGAVVRALASHQCVPGSIPGPGTICGWRLLLVLCSLFLPCSERFFSGNTGFPLSSTFPNSNSIRNCQALCHEPLARVNAQALPVFDLKFAFLQLHLLFSIDVFFSVLYVTKFTCRDILRKIRRKCILFDFSPYLMR